MCLIKDFLFYWVRYYYSPTLCTKQHGRQQQLQSWGWVSKQGWAFPHCTPAPQPGDRVKGQSALPAGHGHWQPRAGGCRGRKELLKGLLPLLPVPPWLLHRNASLAPPARFPGILEHGGGSGAAIARFEAWQVSRAPSSPGTAEPSARAALEPGASCSSSVPAAPQPETGSAAKAGPSLRRLPSWLLIIQAIFTLFHPPTPFPNCLILFSWSFFAEDGFQELRPFPDVINTTTPLIREWPTFPPALAAPPNVWKDSLSPCSSLANINSLCFTGVSLSLSAAGKSCRSPLCLLVSFSSPCAGKLQLPLLDGELCCLSHHRVPFPSAARIRSWHGSRCCPDTEKWSQPRGFAISSEKTREGLGNSGLQGTNAHSLQQTWLYSWVTNHPVSTQMQFLLCTQAELLLPSVDFLK